MERPTENESYRLIEALKAITSGFDYMNSMSLKISSEFLVNSLTHICNLSLTQGMLPIERCKFHIPCVKVMVL